MDGGVDGGGIDQGFVALDIDHEFSVAGGRNFGHAIGARDAADLSITPPALTAWRTRERPPVFVHFPGPEDTGTPKNQFKDRGDAARTEPAAT